MLAFARYSAAGASGVGRLRLYAFAAVGDCYIPTNRALICRTITHDKLNCHPNASGRRHTGTASSALQRSRCCPVSTAIGGLQHAWPASWSYGVYQPD